MPPKFYKKKGFVKKSTTTLTATAPSTATFLIIVESPSKCKKIESYLGDKYCCIASKGHIREIKGLKSIKTKENYEITFETIDDKQTQVKMLQQMVNQFAKENILLATDDDREGEAIAWHICKVCNMDPLTTHRILFHEITKTALQKAVETPTKINMNLVHAQHARQVLDMLVGFKISPLLWKQIAADNSSLSAGRCQTPALRLVFDNEEERKTTKETVEYKVAGVFTEKKLEFELSERFSEDTVETETQVKTFLKSSVDFQHAMTISNVRISTRSAPLPFNTSRLLQAASNELAMSPNETMSHCQQLYQNGWITYMRTDSQKYSPDFIESATKYIEGQWGADYAGDTTRIVNTNTNNPHEAIRVTKIEARVGGKDGRESKLYRLIWKNTVKSCMSDMKIEITPLEITSPMKDAVYKHEIEMPLFMGWKQVDASSSSETSITEAQSTARALKLYVQLMAKENVKYEEIKAICVMNKNHSYYSESSLIKKLEDLGIGRPSTFAMMTSTIQERGYVVCKDIPGEKRTLNEYGLKQGKIKIEKKEKIVGAEKKKLTIEPLGRKVLNLLMEEFSAVFSYDYTKNMESELDEVSNGNKEWYKICEECDEKISVQIREIEKVLKKKYKISDSEDTEWEFAYSIKGPILRRKNEKEEWIYKTIKPDIEIDKSKLLEGTYTTNELAENNDLGEYENGTIEMKRGKYGPYIEWKTETETKKIAWKGKEPTREKVIEALTSGQSQTSKNMIRELTPEMSIRKGKYGAYVYYKTESMGKPQFYDIKKFPLQYTICEKDTIVQWIKTTYHL